MFISAAGSLSSTRCVYSQFLCYKSLLRTRYCSLYRNINLRSPDEPRKERLHQCASFFGGFSAFFLFLGPVQKEACVTGDRIRTTFWSKEKELRIPVPHWVICTRRRALDDLDHALSANSTQKAAFPFSFFSSFFSSPGEALARALHCTACVITPKQIIRDHPTSLIRALLENFINSTFCTCAREFICARVRVCACVWPFCFTHSVLHGCSVSKAQLTGLQLHSFFFCFSPFPFLYYYYYY